MSDPELEKKGEGLLFAIARRAIEYAHTGNKGGLIRLRYLARHISELLPFRRLPRLPERTADEDALFPKKVARNPKRRRH